MNSDDTVFSTRLVVLVAAGFVLVFALLGVGAVALAQSDVQPGPRIVVDHAAVDQWKRALAPGLADLNSLDGLPGLDDDGPAQVIPCSIDSGELWDLEAGRSWTALVPGRGFESGKPSVTGDTARGFRTIIRRLVAAGWRVTDRETNLGMELPAGLGFDSVGLERIIDRTALRTSIQVWDDGVNAYLDFEGARDACRLAK